MKTYLVVPGGLDCLDCGAFTVVADSPESALIKAADSIEEADDWEEIYIAEIVDGKIAKPAHAWKFV